MALELTEKEKNNKEKLINLYKSIKEDEMLSILEKHQDEINFRDIDQARKTIHKLWFDEYVLKKTNN